jgi:hypothetical protein
MGRTELKGTLSSDRVLEIMEGMCWTLRARFTDDKKPHEDYEWVVEGCAGIEMGRGSNIHLAVEDAFSRVRTTKIDS